MSTSIPALRKEKKKKAGPAKQRTEEMDILVDLTFSAYLPRRLVGDCDLLQWFLEKKSFDKYLWTIDFVLDPVGLI